MTTEIMEASEPATLPVQVNNTDTSALVHYDAACKALAEARAVDEVQGIRAEAEAVRAYAKQAKNRQMELDAAEIRIRAERRLGELMKAQAESVGKSAGSKGIGTSAGYNSTRTLDAPPTLAEAGIDKNLAHRARTYAAVPKEEFEQLLSQKRRRENTRVVLDPEFQAEVEAAARDIEIARDERIALSGAGEIEAENENLKKQIAQLDKRINSLVNENNSLTYREKMWRERALAAGWKERTEAVESEELSAKQATKMDGIGKSSIYKELSVREVSTDHREMVAADLGDPLLITNPFRAKVRAAAATVKRAPVVRDLPPPDTRTFDEIAGEMPAFLRRERKPT